MLREEAEEPPVVLRSLDECLSGLWRRANCLAEFRDDLRVQLDTLPAQLVEGFDAHHVTREAHQRGEDTLREREVQVDMRWAMADVAAQGVSAPVFRL